MQSHNESEGIYPKAPVVFFQWKARSGWPIQEVTDNVDHLGYSRSDLESQEFPFEQMIYQPDLARVKEVVHRALLEGQESLEQSYRMITGAGELIWVYGHINIIREKNGDLCCFHGCIINDHHIRSIVKELPGQEMYMQLVTENIHDVVCLQDMAGSIVYITPSVSEVLGYSPEEVRGLPCSELVHPDDLAALHQGINSLVQQKEESFRLEYRMRHKNEGFVWFDGLIKLLRNSAGEPVQILRTCRDISDKREYESRIERLTHFPEENPNAVLSVDGKGNVLYANFSSKPLFYLWGTEEQVPGYFLPILREVLEQGRVRITEMTIKDRVIIFTLSPLLNEQVVHIYALDVTDIRYAKKEISLNSRILNQMQEGVVVTDAKGIIQEINEAFTQITGYTASEVIGRKTSVLKSDRHDKKFYENMWSTLKNTGSWEGEIWNRRKNGEVYLEWLSISAIEDDVGQVEKYISIFSDRSEVQSKEEAINYYLFYDPLTQLPNRSLLEQRINRLLSRASKSSYPFALFFINVDRFKVINDSLGPTVGDQLLQSIAARLNGMVEEPDFLARQGGDDFVLLIGEASPITKLSSMAQEIIESFEAPFVIDGYELFATVSIGISIYPDDGDSLSDLLRKGDMALGESKAQQGNQFHFFSAAMDRNMHNRVFVETELKKALTGEHLINYYQPIVDSQSLAIIGAEALVRWQHPERGLVSPAEFIPIAEETGLIREVNDWVLQQAMTDQIYWLEHGFADLHVSVNTTAHQFQESRILHNVEDGIKRFGADPRRLHLEITENSLMQQAEEIVPLIQQLRDMGVSFAVDDFGTGYSSLSYLKKLPLDYLKLDRSFVMDLPNDDDSAIIATSIMVLAHSLALSIISEGVETREQFEFLQDSGSQYIQGFLFSKPLPRDDFLDLVRQGPFVLS